MENASLIGLSRQVALRRELDVIAHNIANVDTAGFKAQRVAFEQFLMPEARGDGFPAADRGIHYVQDRGTWRSMASGAMETTAAPLDVAVNGDGFFVVETAGGERLTRNGAFQVAADGTVVTAAGDPVLTTAGRLVLAEDETGLTFGPDGTITTSAGERGRLRLATVDDPQALTAQGDSLFEPGGPLVEIAPGDARVMQGVLEKSNVRPIVEISRLMQVTRSYESLASLMQRGDDLRRGALERLADIPA